MIVEGDPIRGAQIVGMIMLGIGALYGLICAGARAYEWGLRDDGHCRSCRPEGLCVIGKYCVTLGRD